MKENIFHTAEQKRLDENAKKNHTAGTLGALP